MKITIEKTGKTLDVAQASRAINDRYLISYLPVSEQVTAHELHDISNEEYNLFLDEIDLGHYDQTQLAAIVLEGIVTYKEKSYYSLPAKHAIWALLA